jgi:hypothetical protein
MQPWSFGSLRVVVALGAKDFEVDAFASSAGMMTMVAVCVLAFATVTTEGALGVDALFAAREGFPGAAGVTRSVDIGAGRFCAADAVTVSSSAATPAAVEKRIRFTLRLGVQDEHIRPAGVAHKASGSSEPAPVKGVP